MNLFVTQILFVKVIMALFYESNHHCIVYYQSPPFQRICNPLGFELGICNPFLLLKQFSPLSFRIKTESKSTH